MPYTDSCYFILDTILSNRYPSVALSLDTSLLLLYVYTTFEKRD